MVIATAFPETSSLHVRVESLTFNRQREDMSAHDPAPPPAPLKQQFLRIMRWALLFSLALAGLAVLLVAHGDSSIHIHMLIATALGVGLTVLLGIALMTLVFLSNRAGHDAAAADHTRKDKNGPRS
jgi:hypothetical protein